MKKGILSHRSPLLQLLLLLLLVLASAFVVSALGMVLALPFIGLESVLTIFDGKASAGLIRYFQMLNSIAVFIVPSLLAAWLYSKEPLKWLAFKKTNLILLFLSFLLIISIQPLTGWLVEINQSISLPKIMDSVEAWMKATEEQTNIMIFYLLDTNKAGPLLFNIFLIAILPAFGEEMLFRGTIQPLILRLTKSPHFAVWLTAIFFSAMHMQFLTFAPRLALGALMGYLMLYGKNIWYPVFAHLLHNSLSLILFYYYRFKNPEINPLEHDVTFSFSWLVVLSIVITLSLILIFKKFSRYSFSRTSFSEGLKT